MQRVLFSDDPGLKIIHPNAGGIDVGNESHFAGVPAERDAQPVQEFGSWTADLHRMGKWLQSCRIDTVAVQATGVYWIPLYAAMEDTPQVGSRDSPVGCSPRMVWRSPSSDAVRALESPLVMTSL